MLLNNFKRPAVSHHIVVFQPDHGQFHEHGSTVLKSITFEAAVLENAVLVNRDLGMPGGTGAELTVSFPGVGLLPGDTFDVTFEVLPATQGGPEPLWKGMSR